MSMMELVRTPVSMLRTQWRPSRPYCWKVSLETSAILQVTFSTLIHVGINHGSVEVMLKILCTYYMRNMVQSTNLWLCTVIEHIRASYIGAFSCIQKHQHPKHWLFHTSEIRECVSTKICYLLRNQNNSEPPRQGTWVNESHLCKRDPPNCRIENCISWA